MSKRWCLALILGSLMVLLNTFPVQADGIIIPPPPPPCGVEPCPLPVRPMAQLNIRYHHVDVKVDQQVAVTHVDQVFTNPNDWPVEGTYVFPLPMDAVVSSFVLWVDGEPVKGKIMDAQEARSTYESIVRQLKDPALLEYIGRGAFQASIFPIPPKGERRIELEYSQVLTAENGLVRYQYPLNTEKFSGKPLENVRITVRASSSLPVRAVYSPTHPIAVNRDGDTRFTASYEANNVTPDMDFSLMYSMGDTEAFHLFSYRDPGDAQDRDGFFMILMAPQKGEAETVVDKDILLVLDRSGSMEGEKFNQAKDALRYILNHLNSGDRFYLMSFSSGIEKYADGLRPAGEAGQAVAWVDRLGAAGSTDINRALLEASAVADRERPTYLIFLTDGLPTEGVTDSAEILKNFTSSASKNLRLFAFGVGYDVDTFLLDSLVQEHHGSSTYVKPGEPLDEILSGFYARVSTPVLTDLSLDFGSLPVYDLYPDPLPDLFEGSQVVIVGRYREGGVTNVTLHGRTNQKERTIRFSEQRFDEESPSTSEQAATLPRIWATRKIGYLLNKIRLQGPDKESIDQIVRLGTRYGIVTPYTSYLVTEPVPLGAEDRSRSAEQTYQQLAAATAAPAFGEAAVEKAAQEGAMSQANVAPAAPRDVGGGEQQQVVKTVGARTFVYQNGVWIDTQFDPDQMQPQQVTFLSDAYFKLLQQRPDLAAAMALGQRVIIVFDQTAVEIGETGGQSGPLNVPTLAPASQKTPTSTPGSHTLQPVAEEPTPTKEAVPTAPICGAGLIPLLGLMIGVWLRRI